MIAREYYFVASQKPGPTSEGRRGDYSDNALGGDLCHRALNTFALELHHNNMI